MNAFGWPTIRLILIAILLLSSCGRPPHDVQPSSSTGAVDDAREARNERLFLTSAAINVLDDLIPLLRYEPHGRSACYVTTAANLDGNAHYIDDEIQAIEKTGLIVERIDLAKLSPDTVAEAFEECDGIWVGGGNTFYLLQEVRRSGFDALVTQKILEGVPYVGTSAGSIILGPDIEPVRFADDATQAPDLTSYEGLNLFPLVPFAHFDNPYFKAAYSEILAFSLEHDVPFVTLKEKQIIVVEGQEWRIVDAN